MFFSFLVACTPSNDLMPLRGEDPEALALSGERADWVSMSGASRSFERFRAALQTGDWEEAVRWLGPTTRAFLEHRARERGTTLLGLVKQGAVEGLGLAGSDDPIRDLRTLPDAGPVREEGPFDPTRTAVTLIVPRLGGEGPIMVPAVYTDDGWRFELVRTLPAAPTGPSVRREPHPGNDPPDPSIEEEP